MTRLRLCQLAGVLLVLAGLKFALIRAHAIESPYMDAWDSEGMLTLGPSLRGELSWRDLFIPVNEHRPAWTKALNLGLTLVNGQWDNRLAATCNVLLPLAAAAWLLYVFGRSPGWLGWTVMAGLLVAGWGLAFVWENTLFSFQSCFYFVMLFGLGYLGGTLLRPVGAPLWWAGQASAAAMLFTLASSFLAPATVLLVLGAQALRTRRMERAAIVNTAMAAIWLTAGLFLIYPVPRHAGLRAGDAGQFFTALGYNLAWPLPYLWGALPVLAPFVCWAAIKIRRQPWLEAPADRLLLALGVWHLLQSAAIAYARGNVAYGMAVRYIDLHVLGVAVSAFCLFQLWTGTDRAPGIRRHSILALAAAWLGLILWSGYHRQRDAEEGFLVPMRSVWQEQAQRVQHYAASGDAAVLASPDVHALPHPSPARIMEVLQQPGLRAYLPASIRPSLALKMDPALSHGFLAGVLPDGRPGWTAKGEEAQVAVFVSEPVAAGKLLPFLRMRVTGGVAGRPAPLQITDAGGQVRGIYQDGSGPADHWRQINLSSPAQPFRLRVELPAGISGGLSAPVEAGRGSWLAGKLLNLNQGLLYGGAALWLLAGAWEVGQRRRLVSACETSGD